MVAYKHGDVVKFPKGQLYLIMLVRDTWYYMILREGDRATYPLGSNYTKYEKDRENSIFGNTELQFNLADIVNKL